MDQLSATSGSPVNPDIKMNESPGGKPERKRTKTGCLTCRQRRIKCGEQRPKCQNCIKSKRECQGYNQRVIFKEPLNALRPPASVSRLATTAVATQLLHQGHFQQFEPPAQRPFLHNDQPSHRTTSSSRTTAPNFSHSQMHSMPIMEPAPMPRPNHLQQFHHSCQPGPGSSTSEGSPETNAPLTPSSLPPGPEDFGYDRYEPSHVPDHSQVQAQMVELHYDDDSFDPHSHKPHHLFPDEKIAPSSGWNGEPNSLDAFHQSFQGNPNYAFSRRLQGEGPRSNGDQYYGQYNHNVAISETQQNLAPIDNRDSSYSPHFSTQTMLQPQYNEASWLGSLPFRSASRDDEDDDVSDVDSIPQSIMYQYDEAEFQDGQLKQNDLGNVMALQAVQDDQNSSLRGYSTFLDDPNALATYQPSNSSDLEDPMTARIFLHFINVTGQNISMYERHPADPLFNGRSPVPHHNLWSYTLPTLALTHSGLLHAILAIGSLHMAKLQDTSTLPSLKHYHIALRRIAKSLNPPRRGHPATLAGTMLLGLYEVLSGGHQKWCSHLLGAKQLIQEINFAEKTKEIRAIKKRRQAQHGHQYGWDPQGLRPALADYDDEVDEDFISVISGQKLNEGRQGSVANEQETKRSYTITDRDIEIYENQRDLFWWYCKIEYESWTDCPPRDPIGRWEASYGTFDHVILLLGRIADFAFKDLARKKKVMQLNGGIWRPHPKMQMPKPPPGHGPPQGHGPHPGQPGPPKGSQMLPFAGMMPIIGSLATLPMGYSASRELPKSIEDWPYMPPAAHMAAGIAAPQTKVWSHDFGRVCGGLLTISSSEELTTLHGSVMIECSIPVFVAAVQYQAPDEREWAVRKLKDIARLTVWEIADVVAGGCEGAWIKTAENGKGPPYSRPEGDLGPGHDRPCRHQDGERGGVYWAFDGNRIGVPRTAEVSGDRKKEKGDSDGVRRDRRAVLDEYRDKEFVSGGR